MRNISETLSLLAVIVGYAFPLLRGIHTFKYYGLDQIDRNVYPHYGNWILLELLYFFSYIISLMLFLFGAFWLKFKSIRKKKYDYLQEQGIEDEIKKMDFNGVWNTKDTDDFLRYLKWEAF